MLFLPQALPASTLDGRRREIQIGSRRHNAFLVTGAPCLDAGLTTSRDSWTDNVTRYWLEEAQCLSCHRRSLPRCWTDDVR